MSRAAGSHLEPTLSVLWARIAAGGGPLPATGRAGNARAVWTERRGLILGLGHAGEGGREGAGLGEATPLPGYSPDTLEECMRELGAKDWRARAGGDRIGLDRVAAIAAHAHAPAARFAIETALLDALGQQSGLACADLLARAAPWTVHLYQQRPVPVNALIADSTDRVAALGAVAAAHERGVRAFKFKIGKPGCFAAELDVLRAVRARHGPYVSVRLDANQAWTADQAAENLARLAEIAPEYVEEPFAHAAAWTAPGAAPGVPLALDESLVAADHAWIAELLARGVARALVLKPMLLGGAIRCLALATLARRHHASAVVTHAFDGPVAWTACAHLALVVGGTCGLDRHAGLAAWPAADLPLQRPSAIAYSPAPGLGLAQSLRDALLDAGMAA